ncbi:hypothetical protein BHM03_00052622 [Ensete ventricosum]|nr:hypothetical protein BHM03_00052622 [Ensete ventricosum]
MNRSVIVRRNYLHYVKKYRRQANVHSNIAARISPSFSVKEGDHVGIGQCRPLLKTARFTVLKVIPAVEERRHLLQSEVSICSSVARAIGIFKLLLHVLFWTLWLSIQMSVCSIVVEQAVS